MPPRTVTRSSLALLLAGLAVACGGREPPPPSAALLPTGDTLILPLIDVTDGAWLGGSRWAVVAPEDHTVRLVDLAARRQVALGGAELSEPFHLFRAGDSLWVADWMRRRATAWSLDGKLLGEFPALDALRGVLPRARDAQGRWYFEARPAPGRDGSGNRDSAVVVRLDGTRLDTIARLAPFDLAEVMSEGRSRLERRLLSGQDRWGVANDGALWVARVDKNRVDWVLPQGERTEGRQLPDRVLPITDNDREIFLSRFDEGLRASVEAIPFAAIKPPFEFALTSPDGAAWLVKSRAVGDTTRYYQVVDRQGRLTQERSHPGLGRVVALGGGEALVAEAFEQGVRLLRFRLPGADAPAAAQQ